MGTSVVVTTKILLYGTFQLTVLLMASSSFTGSNVRLRHSLGQCKQRCPSQNSYNASTVIPLFPP